MEKKIIISKKKLGKKKNKQPWNNKEYLFDDKNHITIINQIFLDQQFEGNKCVKRELNKKIASYKQQDLKKKKYHSNDFIKINELIEKLVVSKLKCFYCRQKVLLLYDLIRDGTQWTLDRIDNNKQHTYENCVICCLKCNLQRRCLDDKKFLFTKQMRLIKKN
tara:strand:- start:1717 stop:2205 length:489 start_codon:yes stop_codon:yes gene_type:complete